jgi:hypothetical protein
MTDLTRLVTLKGSIDEAVMKTTDGETCLKSSMIESVQVGLAFNSGIPSPIPKILRRIENNKLPKLFMLIPPSVGRFSS